MQCAPAEFFSIIQAEFGVPRSKRDLMWAGFSPARRAVARRCSGAAMRAALANSSFSILILNDSEF
jgi:hypothetical protein